MIYSYAITTLLQKSHGDNIDVNDLYLLHLRFDSFFCLAHNKCVFKERQNFPFKQQFSCSTNYKLLRAEVLKDPSKKCNTNINNRKSWQWQVPLNEGFTKASFNTERILSVLTH